MFSYSSVLTVQYPSCICFNPRKRRKKSVHPRMGYDMSDSIFMQEMQAAGRDKESRKALEERAALEAFRAAALQVCVDGPFPCVRHIGSCR